MATIRRVPSLDHNFQLVITRVYAEGEQELLEDEEESELIPLLCRSLQLTPFQLMRSACSLSAKSSSSVLLLLKTAPASYGAIWRETSTNFTTLWHPGRTSRPGHSLKRACIGQCTSASTRRMQTIP